MERHVSYAITQRYLPQYSPNFRFGGFLVHIVRFINVFAYKKILGPIRLWPI